MAARRTKKKDAEPAAEPAAAPAAEPEPTVEPEPTAEPAAEPEPTAKDAGPDARDAGPDAEPAPEAGFENRAARRARGKRAQQPKAAGKIEPHGRRAQAQAPRSWANRRSG